MAVLTTQCPISVDYYSLHLCGFNFLALVLWKATEIETHLLACSPKLQM